MSQPIIYWPRGIYIFRAVSNPNNEANLSHFHSILCSIDGVHVLSLEFIEVHLRKMDTIFNLSADLDFIFMN